MLFMKHSIPSIALLALGVTTFGSFSELAQAAEFECVTAVTSISNRSKMESGDFSANSHWSELRLNQNSLGYGQATDRKFEVTIVDGTVYQAHPLDGKIVVRDTHTPDEGVAMLQIASPEQLSKAAPLDEIGSFDDLAFEFDSLVDDLGCDDTVLLPFKIVGHASSLTWAMDTKPVDQVVNDNDLDVVIIGLYNRNDRKTTFMVPGYNLHAHVLIPGTGYAGHLRDVQLDEGATLYLPTK